MTQSVLSCSYSTGLDFVDLSEEESDFGESAIIALGGITAY